MMMMMMMTLIHVYIFFAECKCRVQYRSSAFSSGPQGAPPVPLLPDAHELPAQADRRAAIGPDRDPGRRHAAQPRPLPPGTVRTTLVTLLYRSAHLISEIKDCISIDKSILALVHFYYR